MSSCRTLSAGLTNRAVGTYSLAHTPSHLNTFARVLVWFVFCTLSTLGADSYPLLSKDTCQCAFLKLNGHYSLLSLADRACAVDKQALRFPGNSSHYIVCKSFAGSHTRRAVNFGIAA